MGLYNNVYDHFDVSGVPLKNLPRSVIAEMVTNVLTIVNNLLINKENKQKPDIVRQIKEVKRGENKGLTVKEDLCKKIDDDNNSVVLVEGSSANEIHCQKQGIHFQRQGFNEIHYVLMKFIKKGI